MKYYVNTVINYKGEGVMLRKPLSVYEHGKSTSVLKVKVKTTTQHLQQQQQ